MLLPCKRSQFLSHHPAWALESWQCRQALRALKEQLARGTVRLSDALEWTVPSEDVFRATRGSLERRHQCAFFARRRAFTPTDECRLDPIAAPRRWTLRDHRRCRVPLLAGAVARRSPSFSARDCPATLPHAEDPRESGRSSATPGASSWRQGRRSAAQLQPSPQDDLCSLHVSLNERMEAIEQASTSRRVDHGTLRV